jgi:3,4-dihydroxy 2-butanone 4-phosphate synthase / GTP cyclohydrolase II
MNLNTPKMQATMLEIQLNTIEEAINAIKNGKIIIVVDDENRENEGDFICAAECITPEHINFMATHGRGLICTPLGETRADLLDLPLMVNTNTAMHETAFTVSIDLIGNGCTTGISSYDRATGIKALTDPTIKGSQFARPGHIFPLRAKKGGVLRRNGHTEAAVDLARMAGYEAVGVLVEILNEDGTMARLPQLIDVAKKHDLKIISIEKLIEYRLEKETIIKREKTYHIQSKFGPIEVCTFSQINSNDIHLAIKIGDWTSNELVPVRVHSASSPIDLLSIFLDDTISTIEKSIQIIQKKGNGVILYMQQMDKEHTIDSRIEDFLHPKSESNNSVMKDYGIGAQIIIDLGIKNIHLITTNPNRKKGTIGYGLSVGEITVL